MRSQVSAPQLLMTKMFGLALGASRILKDRLLKFLVRATQSRYSLPCNH
jgi:hypothetical protein